MSSSRAPSAFGAPKPPVSADTVPPKLTVEEQKKRNDLAEYKKAVQKMKQQAGTSGSSAAAAAPFAAPAPVV